MKKIITVFVSMFLLFLMGCQSSTLPDVDGEGGVQNQPEQTNKKEVSITFDNNCPLMNGTVLYSCSEYAPATINGKEGDVVTLPAFTGTLTKYVGSDLQAVYNFKNWNTTSDATGISYAAGENFTLTQDITLYAIYDTNSAGDTGDDSTDTKDKLNFSSHSTYQLKMGATVELPLEIEGVSVYYEIQSGSDVVQLGTGNLLAIGPGTAIVKASDWDNSKTWSCAITVTVEGFTGSALDYKLVGQWNDGDSYLIFNSDKTGELKVYDGSKIIQESTFEWSTKQDSTGDYFMLKNCSADYLEGKQFTITKISATSMSLHGYMAFGSAQNTSWVK